MLINFFELVLYKCFIVCWKIGDKMKIMMVIFIFIMLSLVLLWISDFVMVWIIYILGI